MGIPYKIKFYQLPYYNKWTLGSNSNYTELNIDPILNRFRSHFNDILLKAIHTLKKKSSNYHYCNKSIESNSNYAKLNNNPMLNQCRWNFHVILMKIMN